MSTFDWTNFLGLAERWFSDEADEATLRSCMSRAYYAAFHVAIDYMRQHTEIPRRDTHSRIWAWLSERDTRQLRNAGSTGVLLRRSRNFADYNSTTPCTPTDARKAIERATVIVTTLTSSRA